MNLSLIAGLKQIPEDTAIYVAMNWKKHRFCNEHRCRFMLKEGFENETG